MDTSSIGARIKAIRLEKKLNQESFGKRLGVGKTAISKLEKNERNLTEQMGKLIMNEFNVSYAYLMEGKGDMFDDLPETLLDELADEYHLTDIQKKLVKTFLELDDEQKDALTTLLEKTFTK
ncbi:helix-turn-helix domain-containing protein [Beduini massiliensis]|uniref:helix-turn-helix domain-containing protein n=1 Tax=Beduini massiliensis TaxID=1585974 RepID=UPI0006934764|nr:helix-turn-helix transcriptional regulator [Beduini massiliensis]